MANLYKGLPKKRVEEVLDMVGMQKRAKDKVKTYSLGMKQRMGIARALLNNPEVVILDEPTNGLDPQGMKEIREMIVQLSLEQDITFFISTHLLHEVELMCNKVGILKQGKKLTEGLVNDLLHSDIETIKIHTPAPEKGVNLLKNITYVKSIDIVAEGLKLKVEKGFSEELINLLVAKKMPVKYVVPLNQSLENYFIKLTEGGEHIA